ncbi:hypothetical protein VTN00DRAFT_5674 [Thermoascus crustaceus]|uniref:uncharacterized protein n=1 Tax=Thermoascus crustaceus TaxID=5088 RepID=UPI003742E1CB
MPTDIDSSQSALRLRNVGMAIDDSLLGLGGPSAASGDIRIQASLLTARYGHATSVNGPYEQSKQFRTEIIRNGSTGTVGIVAQSGNALIPSYRQ